jgi:proteasome accessory factor B
MRKVERLLNLVALLRETRRPLTAEQIRTALYPGQSDAAFRRMFERDKEELREIGVPVERVATDAWEVEEGYLIDQREATLPDLGLTPDEHAALWLAAGAWQGQFAGGDAQRAVMKLSSLPEAGRASDAPEWIAPRVELASPALPVLLDAIARRKRVSFAYRTGGAGKPAKRDVEPHALTARGGWYLTGFDRRRKAVRHFKLSRIAGDVKVNAGKQPDFEPPPSGSAHISHGPWEGDADATARVAFGPATAWWAERRTAGRARRVEERADGWVVLDIPVADRDVFLTWILGFADDAEVLAPRDLRDTVVSRLEAMA